MTQAQMTQQTRALTLASRKHEEEGDTLLSEWMRASAKHFEKLNKEVDRLLNKVTPIATPTVVPHGREEFVHDWYEWQDEYLSQGCGRY